MSALLLIIKNNRTQAPLFQIYLLGSISRYNAYMHLINNEHIAPQL